MQNEDQSTPEQPVDLPGPKRPPSDLVVRTREFSLRVIRPFSALGKDTVSQVIGRQMLRSATSVGAHYREARRARSVAEFVSKMEVGLQELEETGYWLELLSGSKLVSPKRLAKLFEEVDELLAIFTASIKTSKRKRHY